MIRYYRDPKIYGHDNAVLPLDELITRYPCPFCKLKKPHRFCVHAVR